MSQSLHPTDLKPLIKKGVVAEINKEIKIQNNINSRLIETKSLNKGISQTIQIIAVRLKEIVNKFQRANRSRIKQPTLKQNYAHFLTK